MVEQHIQRDQTHGRSNAGFINTTDHGNQIEVAVAVHFAAVPTMIEQRVLPNADLWDRHDEAETGSRTGAYYFQTRQANVAVRCHDGDGVSNGFCLVDEALVFPRMLSPFSAAKAFQASQYRP